MNYSVELWDSYNKVENNLLFHLRGLKDFIYMIKELTKSMKVFSEGLKKVYDMNLRITTNESLSMGIEYFRNILLNQHNFLEKYILDINTRIINPLNILQETILKKLNHNYKETINSERNYESYIAQVEFTLNKFHSRAKQVEQSMLELEKNKANKDIDKKDIEKLEKEVKSSIGFAKDSEKMYLSYVKYTNRIQDEFIETKKKNLNEIQSLEIELGEKIKNSLNTYYILKTTYLKNLKLETEKKIKLLEEIDINSDIDAYIKKNRTDTIPPFRFEYVPYICNIDKQNINNNDEISKKINIKVKEELKKLFPEEKDISLLRTKTDKEIQNFIDSLLNGENEKLINTNEENLKIVSNKTLRRLSLNYLNKLRNFMHITLNDISYRILGDLLKECLNHSYKEKDFISIKLIMIISTNLFKINRISNKPRIFLHNYLIKNNIWKDFYFWQNLIKYDIIEEMHNQKKYNLFSNENDVLKNIRIKDIVKSQLNTNLYNMISFEVNYPLMSKIINYFSNFYKLQKYAIDSLNNIINNYKSQRIELKEKKRLNSSFDLSLRNKNTCNGNKNIFNETDLKNKKNKYNIEPVKQDDQNMNDYFVEMDKEINKKKVNIFNDKNFNNIIIMESKNKNENNVTNEDDDENNDEIKNNDDDFEDENEIINNN